MVSLDPRVEQGLVEERPEHIHFAYKKEQRVGLVRRKEVAVLVAEPGGVRHVSREAQVALVGIHKRVFHFARVVEHCVRSLVPVPKYDSSGMYVCSWKARKLSAFRSVRKKRMHSAVTIIHWWCLSSFQLGYGDSRSPMSSKDVMLALFCMPRCSL